MGLLDQSGVTGGGLYTYNVHALFVNMDNMWTERFGNYDCLVLYSVYDMEYFLRHRIGYLWYIMALNSGLIQDPDHDPLISKTLEISIFGTFI